MGSAHAAAVSLIKILTMIWFALTPVQVWYIFSKNNYCMGCQIGHVVSHLMLGLWPLCFVVLLLPDRVSVLELGTENKLLLHLIGFL